MVLKRWSQLRPDPNFAGVCHKQYPAAAVHEMSPSSNTFVAVAALLADAVCGDIQMTSVGLLFENHTLSSSPDRTRVPTNNVCQCSTSRAYTRLYRFLRLFRINCAICKVAWIS